MMQIQLELLDKRSQEELYHYYEFLLSRMPKKSSGKSAKTLRGALKKWANPDKRALEKEAWPSAAAEKHSRLRR